MRTITGKNCAALEPNTPLKINTPCRYVRCNLLNRTIHEDSITEHCQRGQHAISLIEEKGEVVDRVSVMVGVGVKGEVSHVKVAAALAEVAALKDVRVAELAAAKVVELEAIK